MDLGLKSRRALVLGSSSGIGRSVAEELVKEGARVALCSRDPERLERARREIGAECALARDLTQPGAAFEVVEEAIRRLGGLDVLVVNTGGPKAGSFLSLSREAWETGFNQLWMSAIEAIKAALPAMKAAQYGRIVLVTSVAAKEPIPDLTISNAFRAGLLGLTKSIAREMAEFNVTINAILPGYIDTERLAELGRDLDELRKSIPARRLGEPAEMGALAAFLASQRAGYLTGQMIVLDGGVTRSY